MRLGGTRGRVAPLSMTRGGLNLMWCSCFVLASALASAPVFAAQAPPPHQGEYVPGEHDHQDYVPGEHRLEGELIAPCCWNQTLDIHDSPIASEMRAEIRKRLRAGESIDQVRAVMVERYGSKILAVQPNSPLRGFAIGLTLMLGAAGALAVFKLRKWRAQSELTPKAPPEAPSTPAAEAKNTALDARLDSELKQFEG